MYVSSPFFREVLNLWESLYEGKQQFSLVMVAIKTIMLHTFLSTSLYVAAIMLLYCLCAWYTYIYIYMYVSNFVWVYVYVYVTVLMSVDGCKCRHCVGQQSSTAITACFSKVMWINVDTCVAKTVLLFLAMSFFSFGHTILHTQTFCIFPRIQWVHHEL